MSRPITRWMAALAIASAAVGLAGAARAQEAVGQWHGAITSPDSGDTVRVGVEISRGADGTLSGFATSPDQTEEKIPIEAITAAGGQLSFSSVAIQGRYEGTWDAGRGAWAGQWRQAGALLPLVLEKGPVPPKP